jgi:hypothetical protein
MARLRWSGLIQTALSARHDVVKAEFDEVTPNTPKHSFARKIIFD